MKLLKRFLSLFVVLLLLCPNAWASNQLVASGAVTQANMRISATTGGAVASGGAFVDFGAANVLTLKLGNLLVIKNSLGHSIQGWIKAAGSGETYGSGLIAEASAASDPYSNEANGVGDWAGLSANATSVADPYVGTYSVLGTATASNYNLEHYLPANSGSGRLLKIDFAFKSSKTMSSQLYSYSGTGVMNFNSSLATISSSASFVPFLNNYVTIKDIINNTSSLKMYFHLTGGVVGDTCNVDNFSVKQVLTPSATGVTITSGKGNATYNWSAKDTAFNYNDSAGYTYRIYKTPPVLVAGPTAVTAANTQLSMVNPAFAYFVGTDLTAYQTGKYLLVVQNATSNILIGMGYISGTAPAGETLGSEIATGTLTVSLLYKITATEANHFFTGCAIGNYFVSVGTETCDANNKVKQVNDPPSTGCRIISTKGTGTQVWIATGAGALNENINYKVYYVGD